VVNKKNELPLFSQDELVGRLEKSAITTKPPQKEATRLPLSNIQELAKELGSSVEDVAEKYGYKLEGEFAVKYE